MRALALMIGPIAHGWAVYLTDGREVARYRGIGAKRRALRHVAHASVAETVDGRWTAHRVGGIGPGGRRRWPSFRAQCPG
jgi:hypothetical protein